MDSVAEQSFVRRRWVSLLVAALALGVVVATTSVTGRAQGNRSWPIRAEYQAEGAAGTSSFVLEAESWLSWRQTQTCCGDDIGLVTELHPDGSFWVGMQGTPLRQVHSVGPGHGAVPLPEFGPRYPSDLGELRAMEGIELVAAPELGVNVGGALAPLREIATTLNLDPAELATYRVARTGEVDGRSVLLETLRTVYLPMNLTLSTQEFEDDMPMGRLIVTELEFLPPTFTVFPEGL